MINKESLVHSSMSLFLKYGIKSVSMDDIARLLGISKKTIYNFISNKKDLVSSVVQAFIDEEIKSINKISKSSNNAVEEMAKIGRHVLQSLRSMTPKISYDLKKYHPRTWDLVERHHFTFIEKTIKENVEGGIEQGFYRTDVDPDIIAKMYVGIAHVMTDEDIFPTDIYQKSVIYEHFLLYHLNGLMNSKGQKELAKHLNLKDS